MGRASRIADPNDPGASQIPFWDHALVQDTNDKNAVKFADVKDNVFSKLETMHTRLESIASSPNGRVSCEDNKAVFHSGEIFIRLVRSPISDCVVCDQGEVILGFG